ncbi:hypothetical protein BLNAU_10571 [Blattamonas nauphoetae]|uniref:Uncharacterized protein n=1 Tax=Blattamonas nauphoetae TaxID=2049346 RepID=A0ABQ9XPQ8_9EUKA|nr:hypothetical protein BLNAU_10571 [Blattamonas nauphoetae]
MKLTAESTSHFKLGAKRLKLPQFIVAGGPVCIIWCLFSNSLHRPLSVRGMQDTVFGDLYCQVSFHLLLPITIISIVVWIVIIPISMIPTLMMGVTMEKSLSSFLHIHSTLILFSLLHPSLPSNIPSLTTDERRRVHYSGTRRGSWNSPVDICQTTAFLVGKDLAWSALLNNDPALHPPRGRCKNESRQAVFDAHLTVINCGGVICIAGRNGIWRRQGNPRQSRSSPHFCTLLPPHRATLNGVVEIFNFISNAQSYNLQLPPSLNIHPTTPLFEPPSQLTPVITTLFSPDPPDFFDSILFSYPLNPAPLPLLDPSSPANNKKAKEDVERLHLEFAKLTFAFVQTTKRKAPISEQQEAEVALSRILREVSSLPKDEEDDQMSPNLAEFRIV